MSEVNQSPPPWVTHFQILLPQPNEQTVLMLRTEQGWQLPLVSATGGWFAESRWVCQVLREVLGFTFEFTTLRYTRMAFNEEERWDRVTIVLECHSPIEQLPANSAWISLDQLAQLTLTELADRAHIQAYLTASIPEKRAPWAKEGWFRAATTWMAGHLAALEMPLTGPVEQIRNWSLSTVLRAPTPRGYVYLKATADMPLFANEAMLVAKLAQLYPQHIPSPLQIEPNHCWMLLADFGLSLQEQASQPDGKQTDLGALFEYYGQLQIDLVNHLDDLKRLGCQERKIDLLTSQIQPLFDDPETQRLMTAQELDRLHTLAPHLQEMCEQLAEYALPATLVHGDLHLGNIAQPDDDYLFFDWSDAAITHPFFDMMELYWSEDVDAQERYLALWTQYEPMEHLREAWALAYPLCLLHQAVSYQHITYGVESLVQPEVSDGISDFLRKLLALNLAPDS